MIKVYQGRGTRKTAKGIAILKIPGTGKVTVNNREFTEYFERD